MEFTNVITFSELFFGDAAKAQDFQHSDLVGRGLTGKDDVAVNGVDRVAFRVRGVFHQIIDGLLTRPLLMVQAGINDEATGAPQLHRQPSKVGIRVGVEAELQREVLGVESPAFGIGRVTAKPAEGRNAVQLLHDGQLHVVTRRAFVIGERFHLIGRHLRHVAQVGIVDSGARAIGRWALVEGLAGRIFAERLDATHFQLGLREAVEHLRQGLDHGVDHRRGIGQVSIASFIRIRVVELFVGAHEIEEFL